MTYAGMKRAEIPFAEVDAAVHACKTASADGVFHVDTAMIRDIAERVGFDQRETQYPWQAGKAWDRFAGQIKRALDKMASANGGCLLRKAGAGTTGPDGREVYRDQVRWYTPDAWAAAERAAADQAAADQAADQHRGRVRGRLAALGIIATSSGREDVAVTLDSWDALLDLAEGGLTRHLASGDA